MAKEKKQEEAPAPQKPSVSRMVHYIKDGLRVCRAAVITGVYDGSEVVDLTVFPPVAQPVILKSVPHSEEKIIDSWHWPERV